MRTATIRLAVISLATLVAFGALAGSALVAWRSFRAMQGMLLQRAPPSPLLAQSSRLGIPDLRDVSIERPGAGFLSAWFVPPRNGATVILVHGAGSDRAALLPELRLLSAAGFGTLAFDWPGLGTSPGQVRWNEARGALTSAIDWVSAQPGVDPDRIGGLGFSIGGYLMTQVAASDQRLRAVILESPSPDFRAYLRLHSRNWGALSEWGARMALRGSGLLDAGMQPLEIIGNISPRPVLLIGGSKDSNVPAGMVTQLFQASREPKELWIVEGASHGDYAEADALAYSNRLTAFLSVLVRQPGQ